MSCKPVRSTGFSRNPRLPALQFRLKAVLQTSFNQFGGSVRSTGFSRNLSLASPNSFRLKAVLQTCGLGAAHALFGDRLTEILDELNVRLAA